jgi:2-methylcitrate dehydratase
MIIIQRNSSIKMSVAQELARYAVSLVFQDTPPDVVYETKRIVLDTLGCAIGGYDSEGRFAKELGAGVQEHGIKTYE